MTIKELLSLCAQALLVIPSAILGSIGMVLGMVFSIIRELTEMILNGGRS